MLSANIPVKFPIKFAGGAPPQDIHNPIPTPSQQSITPGLASLTDGFPPATFLPVTAGGTPPFGQDFNGILFMLSAWAQWQAAGGWGATFFDASFVASIGGYPGGAVLAAAGIPGYFWYNTIDGNSTNPDSGGAGWIPFNLYGTHTTGDVKFSLKPVADPGWIPMNDGSIGDASSGATTLANIGTRPLFTLIYNSIVDTWAPLQTSGGGATTRAIQGTAAAAFAAHCRIVLPKMLGRALCTAGAGASLTSRALGETLGEETHTLTAPEIPTHTHQVTIGGSFGAQYSGGVSVPPFVQAGSTTVTSGGGTGGNGPHNNMQPSSFLTAMVAL